MNNYFYTIDEAIVSPLVWGIFAIVCFISIFIYNIFKENE